MLVYCLYHVLVSAILMTECHSFFQFCTPPPFAVPLPVSVPPFIFRRTYTQTHWDFYSAIFSFILFFLFLSMKCYKTLSIGNWFDRERESCHFVDFSSFLVNSCCPVRSFSFLVCFFWCFFSFRFQLDIEPCLIQSCAFDSTHWNWWCSLYWL